MSIWDKLVEDDGEDGEEFQRNLATMLDLLKLYYGSQGSSGNNQPSNTAPSTLVNTENDSTNNSFLNPGLYQTANQAQNNASGSNASLDKSLDQPARHILGISEGGSVPQLKNYSFKKEKTPFLKFLDGR